MKQKEKRKYNYLRKNGTHKSRSDYIETDYINGVRDEKGCLVMRPLTDSEKQVLEQFYKETIHTAFNNTEEIKTLMKEYKKLDPKSKEAKILKTEIEALREESGNFYNTAEERSALYKENYSRNLCVYNKSKASERLFYIDKEELLNSKQHFPDPEDLLILQEFIESTYKEKK